MSSISKNVIGIIIVGLCAMPGATYAATSCPTFTRTISFGATGAEVTKLQTFLKSQGYFKATMVPRFGAATLSAVRAFQKAHGISTTGTVGPLTRAAILKKCVTPPPATQDNTTSASITPTDAPTTFEVTGWIPYWRSATGTADVLPHLSSLTEVNPFVYTIKSDGSLLDNGSLDQEPWLSFNTTAKAQGVRVVPTVMTSNSALVHELLSNPQSRAKLVDTIVSTVQSKGFDGIDIDFEGKRAETRDSFSLFLKELKQKLGTKWLMCTIETRTPIEDRYFGAEVPAEAGIYANDLKAINAYCDRVRLMTYDQQGIDLKLSTQAGSQLYAPNGDPAWITKVVDFMSKDIARNKILIGVPTYGYEYKVTTYEGGQHMYDVLWTFNPGYAVPQAGVSAQPLSQKYNVTPERTSWGELAFTYVPVDEAAPSPSVSAATQPGAALAAAAAASQFADQYSSHLSYRYVVWPDEVSTRIKIDLAKRLGVRGISIFKFDGGQDPDIWNVLTGVRQ